MPDRSIRRRRESKTIYYAAGPGDIIGTFRHWERGKDDPNETAVCYSTMFFDICQRMDLNGYVVSSHADAGKVTSRRFTVEHRPRPSWATKGFRYHVGRIFYVLSLLFTAWRVGAKFAVFADVHHWWVLSVGRLLGIQIVPSLHCTFWPLGMPRRGRAEQLVDFLNGLFWRYVPPRTICISP
jgi:glycogen synthase